MGLIVHANRFQIKRQIVRAKEEDNDKLLVRMQTQIDGTLDKLRQGVDSMRILFETSKLVQDEQEEFRDHLRVCLQQSVRLANFAGLLTDHGPIRQIKNMREINGSELLTPDALPLKEIYNANDISNMYFWIACDCQAESYT